MIVGLVLLIVALVFLSQGVKKAGPSEHEVEAQEQAHQATPPPGAATGPSTGDAAAALPPEQTVGDPATAKHRMTVGWVYTEQNQPNTGALAEAIRRISGYAGKGGTVSAEIVNLDVPPEDRSPAAQAVTTWGVTLDGRPVFEGDLGTGTPERFYPLQRTLDQALAKH